jgi:poly(beta-D-mannuronate) lyase
VENYFFGNNISETGGVRIIGENHNVYNNYFENLKGTNYRAALCIVRGKQNSALNEYFQVKNALVAFNTFVNCAQAFCINYNSSSSLTLPPVNTTIAHNHIYNTSTACYNVVVDQTNVAKMTVSWKNNLMNQGKYSSFSFAPDQIITGQDAAMERVNTSIPIYEPTINSALKNFITNEYAEIISDIRGRIRGENKIPGVSQLSGTTTRTMPDRETVGALFFNNRTTNSPTPLFGKKLTYHYTTSGIEVNTTSPGFITISDLNGTILFTKKTDSSLNINNFSKKGIYLLKFTEQNGTITSQKILIKN